MSYPVREQGDYTIVELTGDVDLAIAPEARKSLLSCLDQGKHLLVDLAAVSYIDSSGIACLVEAFQGAKKKDLRFGLVGVSEAAMKVLQLARLDKVFPVHATADERIAADG